MTRFLRGASALLCALLLPALACAATLTATDQNSAWSQLDAAAKGDTVQLKGGQYGKLDLYNKKKDGVLLTVAPGETAVVSELFLDGSSGLRVDPGQGVLDVAMLPAAQYGVSLQGTVGVIVNGVKIHQADNQTMSGVGVFVRNAQNSGVTNSELSWLGVAASTLDSSGTVFSGNAVHDVNVDGFDMAGADGAQVIGNTVTNSHPGDGDHPDCIQFWPTAATPNPSNILIKGNRCERGAGGIVQGIFIAGGSNYTITGNTLLGTMYNGVSLSGVHGAQVTGNFLQPYPDMGTQMLARDTSDSVSFQANASPLISNYNPAGEAVNTNITIGPFKVTTAAVAGDYGQLAAWQASTGATVPPPAPVPPPVVVTPPAAQTPVPDPLQPALDASITQAATLKAKIAKAQAALTAYPSNTAKQLQTKIANALAALK